MGHQALHGDSVSADSLTQKKSRSVSGTVHSAESFRGLGGILSSPRDGTVPFPPPRVQEMGASHQSLWWRRRRAEDWLPIRQVCHGPAHVSQSAFAQYIYVRAATPERLQFDVRSFAFTFNGPADFAGRLVMEITLSGKKQGAQRYRDRLFYGLLLVCVSK